MPQTFVLPNQVGIIDGQVTASAVLKFYRTGTSTPQSVYTDADLTNAVTQIQADSAGVFPKVYLNPNAPADYRSVLEKNDGTSPTIEDDISRLPFSGTDVGAALYPQNAAEEAATITPITRYSDEIANVRRYGPAIDGTTNDADALSDASTGSAGKIILLPKGTYLVTGTWSLSAGTIYQGEGPGTIIRMQSQQVDVADLAGVTFRNMKFTGSVTTAGLRFTRCDDLTFENCDFDGTISGGNPGGTTAIWLKACDRVRVRACNFTNYYQAVYADADALAEKSGTVWVDRCHCEHTFVSTGSYPAQFYQYQCDHMYVDGCSFRNILPGGALMSPRGYCFYQGDGVGITSSIKNSWATCSTSGSNTGPMVFAQAANTTTFTVESNYFNGGGEDAEFATGSARTLTQILNNYIQSSYILLQPGDGATLCESVLISGNYLRLANSTIAAVRVGANSNGFNYLNFCNNTVNGSSGGGLFVSDVRRFSTVRDNDFLDCNTTNTAFSAGVNEFSVSCVSFFGSNARFGLLSGNHCENTLGGTGHADFGFACDATTHSIDLRPDNRFIRMDTSAHRNTLKTATNPWPWTPPGGMFWFGDPATGGPPGRVCTHNFATTIRTTEAAAQTTLDVTSNTSMANDDFVAVLLDTGAYHYSFITGTGAGPTITINDALPSQAAAGNEVVVARFKAMANLA